MAADMKIKLVYFFIHIDKIIATCHLTTKKIVCKNLSAHFIKTMSVTV